MRNPDLILQLSVAKLLWLHGEGTGGMIKNKGDLLTDEYFATGFRDVDGRDDPEAYGVCLRFIDSLPYYREVKERSYELLRLTPGLAILDVGSGLGDDAIHMAPMVTPGGNVVGVDASERMVEDAGARVTEGLPVRFLKADARAIPFGDAAFDRVRIDRTLQHIPGPKAAMREMVRVLKPGGLLLAYDNDWETFSILGGDDEVTGVVESLWRGAFANPRIGRDIEICLIAEGLTEIRVYRSVSVIDDFATADKIYNLTQSARRAADAGSLAPDRAGKWLRDLGASSVDGAFRCTLAAYTVVGRKPMGPQNRRCAPGCTERQDSLHSLRR